MSDEELLAGGNTTVVVRVGDAVRRPVGPWSAAVHDLLDHLRAVGFTGSPVVVGIDSHAATLDDMARTGPAFEELVARGYARAARADADWWRTGRRDIGAGHLQ